MLIVKCLICEKDLEQDDHGLVYGAGFAEISFHYGSKHDQCKGLGGHYDTGEEYDELLSCNKIEAFICDECFKAKHKLCQGFEVHTEKKETRVV